MSKELAGALYGLLGILAAGLAAFGIELGAGRIPIPPEYHWAVPILSAVIVAATTLLRQMTDEE